MDYLKLIDKYYGPADSKLKDILLIHSRAVTARALRIVDAHPELNADRTFVEEAAMLHDIGILKCDAPSIECHGTEPYLLHGKLGADIMRAEGYPLHARVCERHTGAGITLQQIEERALPLPKHDYLPESIEEKIVCYADKFYSKSHLEAEKTPEQVEKSLAKFGSDGVERFREWKRLFE